MASLEGRFAEFRKLENDIWNSHSSAGNWFSGSTRMRIALSAEAAVNCPACCGKAGSILTTDDLFQLQHDCISHDRFLCDDLAASVLVPIVHTVANFQHRIDKSWVSKVQSSLSRHFLEVEGISDMDELDLSSAYCEVVIITALSVGLRTLREQLCTSTPERIPSSAEDQPKRIRFTQILSRSRRDPSTGWLPFFFGSDLVSPSPRARAPKGFDLLAATTFRLQFMPMCACA